MSNTQTPDLSSDLATPSKSKPHSTRPTTVWWRTRRAAQVGVAVSVLILLGAVVWWVAFRPFVSTDDARIGMTMIRLAPSGVSGRIEKVNVEEGSRVKAGDILVEIDHRVPQANYEKAKARAVLAEREMARMTRLTSEGSATPQSLDQARAALASADVELKIAEVALENTYLKSPFDGVVIQKLAEVGNILEQNQTAVVVADETHAWVAANIEETAIGSVKIGQPADIEVDEGGTLHGKVAEIRSSVASQFALIPSDTGAGNFTKVVQRVPIKITLDDGVGRHLRAGQSVEIKIRVR